jgi:hypothetical protein
LRIREGIGDIEEHDLDIAPLLERKSDQVFGRIVVEEVRPRVRDGRSFWSVRLGAADDFRAVWMGVPM